MSQSHQKLNRIDTTADQSDQKQKIFESKTPHYLSQDWGIFQGIVKENYRNLSRDKYTRKDVLKMIDTIAGKIDALKEPANPDSDQKSNPFVSKIPHYLPDGSDRFTGERLKERNPRELTSRGYLLDLVYSIKENNLDEDQNIVGYLVAMSAYVDLFAANGGVIDDKNSHEMILALFFLARNFNLDVHDNYDISNEMIIGGLREPQYDDDIEDEQNSESSPETPEDVIDDETQEIPMGVIDDEIPQEIPMGVIDDEIPQEIPMGVIDDESPQEIPMGVIDNEIPQEIPMGVIDNDSDKPDEAQLQFIKLKNHALYTVGFENLHLSKEKSDFYLHEAGLAIQVDNLDDFEIQYFKPLVQKSELFPPEQTEDKERVIHFALIKDFQDSFDEFEMILKKEMKNLASSPNLKDTAEKYYEASRLFLFNVKITMDLLTKETFSKDLAAFKETLDSINIVNNVSPTFFAPPQASIIKHLKKMQLQIDELAEKFKLDQTAVKKNF